MSKIICEVCGTSYPSSAAQCPICGCVRPQNKQPASGDVLPDDHLAEEKTKKPVRGGRYSKANVRKRNMNNQIPPETEKPTRMSEKSPEKKPSKKSNSNKGLTILAVILLLAIIAMLIFIALRFFAPFGNNQNDAADSTPGNTIYADNTSGGTEGDKAEDTTVPDLSCTDLLLSSGVVELTSEGQACLLNVTPVPADTLDKIEYESSDESVVIVSSKGKVVAIAPGQAEIIITCGDVVKKCRVVVYFEEETTEPEDTTAETTVPEVDETQVLELNREDITMSRLNEEWQLYTGSIAKPLITFTSGNPSVATFEGGKVVAVGPGTTTVYAEYGNQKVSCIIRCNFTVSGDSGFNTGVGEG